MFEAYTYEALLEDVISNAPDNVDTRQGSIFYDAVSGILMKVAKLYTDLDLVLSMSQLDSTAGEYLDAKAAEYGLTRQSATYAEYYVTFEGTTPDVGERFYYDGLYFILCYDVDEGVYYLQAEAAGTGSNGIYDGTPAIPVNSISGLTSATFGLIRTYGTDEEDDDSLRSRIEEKIAGPAENGNKAHYKTWCESVDGVGLAKITPLWNGPNTVKAVLISSLGLPCSDSVVEAVQEYVDPATKGYTATVNGKTYVVGDGLGEGVANLGAHFTACAPDELPITVACSATLASGHSEDDAAEEAEEALSEYLQDLVLNTGEDEDIVVRITAIGAILTGLTSITDYESLTVNGGTANITADEDEIPVFGEVDISAV